MDEPKYTIYVRVPIPRGDFVDPPQVDWDAEKDEALWRILSSVAQKEIDWNDIAAKFDVTVDWLLKQVAYLTEKHASQVRAQVRKAAAAAKGSAAPSPVPAAESSTAADRRSQLGQPIGRDPLIPRNEPTGTIRPAISRGGSGNTVSRDIVNSSLRPESKQLPSRTTGETTGRRRLSSLAITASGSRPAATQEPGRDETVSPGPPESSSGESSEDESSPAQSRIIRRPPRYQENDASYQVDDDGDDESEPAFQPYKSSADQNSASDLASTLRGDSRTSTKRGNKHLARERIHRSQTSDSSAGSGAPGAESSKTRRPKSHNSNQKSAQSALSPSGKGKLSSQDGSDGTPSMGSSFSDLDGSYFVNDEDEIRSIADPDYYFNYFLSRNPRVNLRQRFQFDAAVQGVIHERLESLDLIKTPLPPVEPGSESRHVNIFVSKNLADAERIIIVFGECAKELGSVANRVVGGPGGVEKGSMIGAVKAMQRHESAGIILANMGESYWSQEHKRAITVGNSAALSMPSLVHMGIKYHAEVNDIPGSESPACHVRTILSTVIARNAKKNAKINIIAIGDSCEVINTLLDDEKIWTEWGPSLQSAVFYSPAFYNEAKQAGLRNFLAKKSRSYMVSEKPQGTLLSGTNGNATEGIPAFGFPCYSSGEPSIVELCFISALEPGLSYLDEVARTPDFENPACTIVEQATAEEAESEWDALAPEQKPSISTVGEEKLQQELKVMRRWNYFEKYGRAPDSDEESDLEDETAGSSLSVPPWGDDS
ncbi:hypothetical protein MY10362_001926 [Beauveria mimosiformis]